MFASQSFPGGTELVDFGLVSSSLFSVTFGLSHVLLVAGMGFSGCLAVNGSNAAVVGSIFLVRLATSNCGSLITGGAGSSCGVFGGTAESGSFVAVSLGVTFHCSGSSALVGRGRAAVDSRLTAVTAGTGGSAAMGA